jgi:murein DD-endopeptidase MepM/ murein hydrolase activator NlpD
VALQAAQDLADAQAVDAQKALELQEANEALAQAQADETAAQQAVDAQQDAIGAYARAIYQDSLPLVAIASLFDADSVTSLGNRIQWTTTILDTNNRIREELEVSHAALVRGRLAREDAQAKADEAKAAAQAQVEATQDAKDAADAAEAQAQAARDAVQNALNEQVAAQEAARQTLEANKDRLAQAQAEKAAVVAAIEERARQEAAAAAAAAAAQGGSGSGGPVPSGNWLTYPVTPVIISSGFGWRVDPISGASAFHNGVDFAAACGTPVRAAASGTVVTKRWAWDGGNELYVDHGWIGGNHVITSYHHMSGYAVNAGVWVSQGQVIGYVGTTGYSTGCHLHLILWLNGTPVNALGYL